MGLAEHIHDNWDNLMKAKGAFGVLLVLGLGGGFGTATYLDNEKVVTAQGERDFYKEKLTDADHPKPITKYVQIPVPDPVQAAEITSLKAQIAAIHGTSPPAPTKPTARYVHTDVPPRQPAQNPTPPIGVQCAPGAACSNGQQGGVTASTVNVIGKPDRIFNAASGQELLKMLPQGVKKILVTPVNDYEAISLAQQIARFLVSKGFDAEAGGGVEIFPAPEPGVVAVPPTPDASGVERIIVGPK